MAGGFKQVPVKYQQKWDKKTASPQGKREMNINIQENCVEPAPVSTLLQDTLPAPKCRPPKKAKYFLKDLPFSHLTFHFMGILWVCLRIKDIKFAPIKNNSFLLKMNHFRVNLGGTPTVLETQPI